MRRSWFIIALLVTQVLCATLYLVNILSSVTGIAPFSWAVHELIELAAALGLLIGVALLVRILRHTLRRNRQVEDQLRAASGAFMELLQDRFDSWGLTPAEQDVALFAIKGLSTQDIAALRETSEGTVKAQTNAIYRKARVTGRPQLLSLFIEDLMDEPVAPRAVTPAAPSTVARKAG